jgi:hypothetical protein
MARPHRLTAWALVAWAALVGLDVSHARAQITGDPVSVECTWLGGAAWPSLDGVTCYGGPPDYPEGECFTTEAEHCLVVYALDEPYQTPNGDWITLDYTLHDFGGWIRECDYANSYLGHVPRSYFEGFDYACWIYRYCKPADRWSCPGYAEECEPPGVDGEGRLNPCGELEDCLFDASNYCWSCPSGTISCSYSMCAYPDEERRAACVAMGSGSFVAISDTGRCGDTRFSTDAYCNIRWWPTDDPPPCFFACDLAALMIDQVAAYEQRTRVVIGDDPLPQYRPAPAEWWIIENWPDFDPDGGTSPGDAGDGGGDPGDGGGDPGDGGGDPGDGGGDPGDGGGDPGDGGGDPGDGGGDPGDGGGDPGDGGGDPGDGGGDPGDGGGDPGDGGGDPGDGGGDPGDGGGDPGDGGGDPGDGGGDPGDGGGDPGDGGGDPGDGDGDPGDGGGDPGDGGGDPDPGGDPGWPECGIDQPCPWNGATGFGDGPDMPQQTVELPGNLWGDGSWLPASCPADESLDFGALGSFDVPFSAMCEVAAALGRWVVIVALIAGAGIIFGSRQV